MRTRTQLHVFAHLHLSFDGSANWSKMTTLLHPPRGGEYISRGNWNLNSLNDYHPLQWIFGKIVEVPGDSHVFREHVRYLLEASPLMCWKRKSIERRPSASLRCGGRISIISWRPSLTPISHHIWISSSRLRLCTNAIECLREPSILVLRKWRSNKCWTTDDYRPAGKGSVMRSWLWTVIGHASEFSPSQRSSQVKTSFP